MLNFQLNISQLLRKIKTHTSHFYQFHFLKYIFLHFGDFLKWGRFCQKCTLFLSLVNSELTCVLFLEIYQNLQEKLNSQLCRPGSNLTKIVDIETPDPPPPPGRDFDLNVGPNSHDSINPHNGLYVTLKHLFISFSSWFLMEEISYLYKKENKYNCLSYRRYMYHESFWKEFRYGVYSSWNYHSLNVHIR